MIKTEELMAKALSYGNLDRYQLAIAVAKRSEQLDNGAPSKLNVDTKSMKSADLALMEIAEGVVSVSAIVDKK